jgi:cytochrome c oxidase assembly protein subunit 11
MNPCETSTCSPPSPRRPRQPAWLRLSLLLALGGVLVAALHEGGQPAATTMPASDSREPPRVITIAFFAYVHDGLTWEFRPLRERVQVQPGELTEVTFVAHNLSGLRQIGRAVRQVTPAQADGFLEQTYCFCFAPQILEGGETRPLALRFRLDPGLPADISTLAVRYVLLPNDGRVGSLRQARGASRTEPTLHPGRADTPADVRPSA